jgi:hypothetical protein
LLLVAPLEARWEQFAPRLQAGSALAWPAWSRYGLYAALTFAGFWGNFGWLQRPLPVWLYGLLALVCLAALVGLLGLRGQDGDGSAPAGSPFAPARTVAASWLLAAVLIAVQTALPMLGRAWQPQGRYLFPALFPLTGLLLLGLDRWLDFGRHPGRADGILVALLAFAAYALLR